MTKAAIDTRVPAVKASWPDPLAVADESWLRAAGIAGEPDPGAILAVPAGRKALRRWLYRRFELRGLSSAGCRAFSGLSVPQQLLRLAQRLAACAMADDLRHCISGALARDLRRILGGEFLAILLDARCRQRWRALVLPAIRLRALPARATVSTLDDRLAGLGKALIATQLPESDSVARRYLDLSLPRGLQPELPERQRIDVDAVADRLAWLQQYA